MDDIYTFNNGEPIFGPEIDAKNREDHEKMRMQMRSWQLDLRETFCNTPAGRRCLVYMLYELGVFKQNTQCNAAAYGFLAKQAVGIELMNVIGVEKTLEVFKAVRKENPQQEKKDA